MPTTLPARYYTDPEYYREEFEHFFLNAWISVGREEEIPKVGDYTLREVGEESLILVRGNDHRVRAFYNVCRHRGTRLCEKQKGSFKGSIQCPYHVWTYALDGRLMAAPHMDQVPGFSCDHYPLKQAACDSWAGQIYVHLGPAPRPLAEQLGPMREKFANWHMEELRVAHRIEYPIQANWKLIIQNYSECLHCPFIHPALSKVSHYLSGENEPFTRHYLGGRMSLKPGVETMNFTGKRTRDYLPGLTDEQRRHVYYWALLPNVLLSAHPDYVMIHTLWPRSERLTQVLCEFLFHPDEMKKPGFSHTDASEFWDLTNREDWRVSELSQRGMLSRAYSPGPYSLREGLLHGLDEIVRQEMGHATAASPG